MSPALVGGVMLLLVAWCGPLPILARESFTAHMTVHLLVVAGAAPLLAIGIAGRHRACWDAAFAVSPIPAALVEFLVVWSWHAPALHHAARVGLWAFAAEQASFLVAGTLFWTAIVAAVRVEAGRGLAAAMGALAMTFGHMVWLGVLLSLSPRTLYEHGDAATLHDQRLGGTVMLVVSGLVYVTAGLFVGRRLLRGLSSQESAA
jgi:putative membrane protein